MIRLVTAQCGIFAVEKTYATSRMRRKEVEEPVREDRADESAGRPGAVREMAPQDGDASELPDPARQHRVRKQSDRECREDLVEARVRRVERLVDGQPPGERAHEHRQRG